MADEVVILENGNEVETTTGVEFSLDEAKEGGFTPEEIEMGVKQGLIKEKKAEPQKKEVEQEIEKAPEAEKKVIDDDDLEAEHERIKDYNANEKALYFRQKKERQKRQKVESERDFLRAQLLALQKKEAAKIEPEIEPEDEEKYVTVADQKRKQAEEDKKKAEQEAEQARINSEAQRIKARLAEQEEEARELDPNFDKICDLAREVMSKQSSGRYAKELVAIAADPEGNAPEFIYEVAQLHPEYQKVKNGKSETEKAETVKKSNNIDRIVANTQKRQSSAAVGGGGSRTVSLDDLTIADVETMSQEQWNKLPQATRDRLLRG